MAVPILLDFKSEDLKQQIREINWKCQSFEINQ